MLVTVARFRDPWEAEMLRGRLEAEDIPAFVIHPYHVAMNWPWSRALQGVKVQVLRDDVAGAQVVFADCLSGAYSDALLKLFGTLGEPQCPNCGSIDCKKRGSAADAVVGLLIAYFFHIVLPPSAWQRTCRVCGTVWRERGDLK